LKRLRDLGNTLVLVEHDREVIEAADHLIDFGPGSGDLGGHVMAAATPAKVKGIATSMTGRYLAGKDAIPVPTNRRKVTPKDPALVVRKARQHNLKDIDATFPLGVVTVVTGVSGSGKSSLVEDILWKAAAKKLHRAQSTPGAHDEVEGLNLIDKVISVDQAPLGGTPTSTPATYSGAYDLIRDLFARMPEAKVRGYSARRFSFNMKGGRCEACEGAGQKKIEMHFLPDVWVTCDACNGRRFTPETLAVTFRGKTIADVLDMKVDAAVDLFTSVPKIRRVLQTLSDVGLGYLPLGQSAPTLSGGEAQRVKLAAELARPDTGKTLYILDEPTTGLHLDDTKKLLAVVHRLADLGNTVVIIEHNLEVIKTADWLIDLGPEAGGEGGTIVAAGPPEVVAKVKESLTGRILKDVLAAGPFEERAKFDPKLAAAKLLEAAKKAAAEAPAKAKAPWEADGRAWHTRDRTARTGKPTRWDGEILARVVDRIQELGDFAETDWSAQYMVKVGKGGPKDWPFLRATTGHEWILTLRFTVRRSAFKLASLERSLALCPFHEMPTPVLSDSPRIAISDEASQEVVITLHSLEEIETKAFDDFLKRAVDSHLGRTSKGAVFKASELS
jgi:excinuclease ABC subunit A